MREHLEDIGVIAERNFLVDSALQKNLVGAFGFCFERLLADLVQTQDVCFGAVGAAAKTAKTAGHFANIGVVYDAERGVAHAVPGEFRLTYSVCGFDNFCPGDIFQDIKPFCRREALLGDCFY